MKRRSFLAALSTLPLVSCLGESVKFRFKVIAKVLVDGQPMERSTVMEVDYARVTHSLTGMGGAATLYGEALIFDMGSRGTFYIIPNRRGEDGSIGEIYQFGLLTTFGITGSVGGLSEEKLQVLRNAHGRRPFNYFDNLPTFVAFSDESDPKTIYTVYPNNIGDHFPGVRFLGLDIEVTKEPITDVIRNRLPWLRERDRVLFERNSKPVSEVPIGFVIHQGDFLGGGT